METTAYQQSRYFHAVDGGNGIFLIYHALFNQPREVEESVVDFIHLFQEPKTLDEIADYCEGDIEEVVKTLADLHLLEYESNDELELLEALHEDFLTELKQGNKLQRLELAISNACNFGCKHCMHFLNNDFETRNSPELNMSAETAKESIDKFIKKVRLSENSLVRIHFGNGEPLLNWKTLLFVLEYCESIPDIQFFYAINTNLSLLNCQKAETLKKYKVKISTSLDGLRETNDLIRIDAKGQGTFDKILSKIRLLESIEYPIDGFSVTVTDTNFALIDEQVIDLGKSLGVKDVSMDFDLVRSTAIPIEDCVNKIIDLRRYAHQQGLNFYGTWETPYRILMSHSWLSEPHAFCPSMEGKTIEFNVDGTLKTCGHTNTVVGNSLEFEKCFEQGSLYMQLIQSRLPGNNQFCKGCEIEGCCAGQCHVTLESAKKDSDLVQRTCELMKRTTKRLIVEYLQGRE
ncbi:radical SAM protein [Roseofilum capinflatum]|uniref:Radical SAM core domain-containing protein n=1 Tax=Roseofilum capinflatum BLCC-M114 TaxID=3022440 RepID=A0ABT7B7K6_9CYAN|nr:radical SAM protein [Roseofilum capinflatum]MDJ1175155.1 hypothetical protein [Roseofilum capinflatum BLCC-M114]